MIAIRTILFPSCRSIIPRRYSVRHIAALSNPFVGNVAIISDKLFKSSVNTDRYFSTDVAPTTLWQRMGFTGKLKHRKWVLKGSALRIYLCCMELPDYQAMQAELQLSDTFSSWFRLVELHIWLAMVRLSQEGHEGKFVRNNVIEFMWKDINNRSKKLGHIAGYSARIEGVQMLGDQFRATLYAYDEGLLSDDHVLAGALWRNLFNKSCSDIGHLEAMVEYVRRQVAHLDQLESSALLVNGLMTFQSMTNTETDLLRHKQVLREIAKRVL